MSSYEDDQQSISRFITTRANVEKEDDFRHQKR